MIFPFSSHIHATILLKVINFAQKVLAACRKLFVEETIFKCPPFYIHFSAYGVTQSFRGTNRNTFIQYCQIQLQSLYFDNAERTGLEA